MVNRNFKQRMKQTLYRLKRDYSSGPVSIYTLNSASTNVQSGDTVVDKEVTVLPHVIVLPATLSREVIQSISHISANKMFAYGGSLDARTRMFIIDQQDAPGLTLKKDSWIVFRGRKYSIKSINDYDFRSGWVVVATEVPGVHPEQIYLKRADDLFWLSDLCETHTVIPVQRALNELKLYGEAANDPSHRATSIISLVQDALHELETRDGVASSLLSFVTTATGVGVFSAVGTSAVAFTAQASAITGFHRLSESLLTPSDEAVVIRDAFGAAQDNLELNDAASKSVSFAVTGLGLAELTSQATRILGFTRAVQTDVSLTSVANSYYGCTGEATSILILNDAAGAVAVFPASATDAIVISSAGDATASYPRSASDTLEITTDSSAVLGFTVSSTDSLVVDSVGTALREVPIVVSQTLVIDVTVVGTKETTQVVVTELSSTDQATSNIITERSASDTLSVTQTAEADVETTGFPGEWSFRMPITIEADYIDADLSDWTYVFDQAQAAALTAANGPLDVNGSRPMVNGGGDIRFSSDINGATRLACDVRRCVVTNVADLRRIEVAVKIPAVSASVDTTIYMWWGKAGETQPAVDEEYGQYATYDSGHEIVLPLSEGSNGTAGEFKNRVSASANATGVSPYTHVTDAVKRIGFAQAYYADNGYINVNWAAGATWTWEVPIHLGATPTSYYAILAIPYSPYQVLTASSTRAFAVWNESSSGANYGVGNFALYTWYHLAFVRVANSTTNGYKAYLDGVLKGQVNTGSWSNANILRIGGRPDYVQGFGGYIDEVRVSDVVRAAAWIKANHSNLLLSNLFSTFGSITDL